jgi:hypothetical protein
MFKFPPTVGSPTKETVPPGAEMLPFIVTVLPIIETLVPATEALVVIEKIAPEENEMLGAVTVMLSNVIAPVDDKNMPRLSESVPPLKERSPAQLKVNGDPTIDDEIWMPEQKVVGAPTAAIAQLENEAKESITKNNLSISDPK